MARRSSCSVREYSSTEIGLSPTEPIVRILPPKLVAPKPARPTIKRASKIQMNVFEIVLPRTAMLRFTLLLGAAFLDPFAEVYLAQDEGASEKRKAAKRVNNSAIPSASILANAMRK